jgi:thiol-disulfide isomerase/thioredoxin
MLHNQSIDTLKISTRNELNFVFEEQNLDTIVPPKQTLDLSINTETRDYYFVTINNKQYRLYAEPDTTIELFISKDAKAVSFGDDFKEINEFLTSRDTWSDWGPWNEGLKGSVAIEDMLRSNDSVRRAQQKQVQDYPGLPSWYRQFEPERLEYINAESDLSALSFRKKSMGVEEQVPSDFLETATKDLLIENNDYLGVIAYHRFLSVYLEYKMDPQLEHSITSSGKDEWIAYTEDLIKSTEEHFKDQKIKEVHLAKFFTFIINYLDYAWKDEWLVQIKDPLILNVVNSQLKATPFLPQGESLPYFKLADLNSNEFESKDFEGKILLINFWATWCAPCIREFPYEDELVEQYKDEPVAIVNICLDTPEASWRTVSDKYDLQTINLFADEAQSKEINQRFGIQGLPHSTLIDSDGKIIKDKCARASAGVDKLIEEALNTKFIE